MERSASAIPAPYIGKRDEPRKLSRGRVSKPTKGGKSGGAEKRVVVALVERGGSVRSFHVESATRDTVQEILFTNASPMFSENYGRDDDARHGSDRGRGQAHYQRNV